MGGKIVGVTAATAFLVSFVSAATTAPANAQNVRVQVSKYWCDKFGGAYDGTNCLAPYKSHAGACTIFQTANVNDAQMLKTLNDVKSAQVCLASRVEEAKSNTLKLRSNIMGYVTAGNPDLENQVDPGQNKSVRPQEGKASYWAVVAYYLYQCVVETCTAK